jgi:hypothetical protein
VAGGDGVAGGAEGVTAGDGLGVAGKVGKRGSGVEPLQAVATRMINKIGMRAAISLLLVEPSEK